MSVSTSESYDIFAFLRLPLSCDDTQLESINRCRVDPKRNSIIQEYILPDLSTNRLGRIRQPGENVTDTDQILIMNNERFTVPELLFRPDDIGKCTSKRRRRMDSTFISSN
jgi:hypothetical protein